MTTANSTSISLGILSGRSEVEPVDPSSVPLFVREFTIRQYFQVALVTVLVYDAWITLNKEVKFFWKRPKRAVDYIFFLNRYVGIFGAIVVIPLYTYGVDLALCKWQNRMNQTYQDDVEQGNFADWTQNISDWVTIISIDYILMIRVLALYSGGKRLSLSLGILLAAEAVFKLVMLIYLDKLQHIAVGGLAKNVTACGVDIILPWRLVMVDWLIPMVYGAVLMMLALYKAAEYWKMSAGFKGFTLVKILIRDQAIYFVLVVARCVFDIIQFRFRVSADTVSYVLGTLGNPALFTILGNRMLFNLKEAAEKGDNEGTNAKVASRTLSDMDFAAPESLQGENTLGFVENNVEA